jgi:hypothetical protein
MPVSLQRKQLPLDIKDPIVSILTAGMSYTFESKGEIESFLTGGSTVVTIDLGYQLFKEMVEWKRLPVNPLPIQVLEVQDWERIIEKLNALEAVSGMLNELTAEQIEIFETSAKRRPLFK